MAEDRPARKADEPKTQQATAATAATDDTTDDTTTPAANPVDLGTDVEKLPPVPGAGQFMDPDDATEEVAPAPERGTQKKG